MSLFGSTSGHQSNSAVFMMDSVERARYDVRNHLVQLRYLTQLPNRDVLAKTIAETSDFAEMYCAYGKLIDAHVKANEKRPNTLRALTNRMICTEIMTRLPDLRALRRVIRVNSFFHDVFKNDEERIKLQIVIDHMDPETFRLAVIASQCKDVAIYDEAETRLFLQAHHLLPPLTTDGSQKKSPPPPARTSFAPDEQRTLLEAVKYDKQVRYLASKYAETTPSKPWWQIISKTRLMHAFLWFRIMYTMFPILHTYDDTSPSPSTFDGYRGNKRNRLLLARAIPERDFADMLTVESWLKRQCKPALERFFQFVPWPFDVCPKHDPKPPMDRKCPAYDEFIMTAGLGHLSRILSRQGFRYIEHLKWVHAHADHGAVAATYANDNHGAAPNTYAHDNHGTAPNAYAHDSPPPSYGTAPGGGTNPATASASFSNDLKYPFEKDEEWAKACQKVVMDMMAKGDPKWAEAYKKAAAKMAHVRSEMSSMNTTTYANDSPPSHVAAAPGGSNSSPATTPVNSDGDNLKAKNPFEIDPKLAEAYRKFLAHGASA